MKKVNIFRDLNRERFYELREQYNSLHFQCEEAYEKLFDSVTIKQYETFFIPLVQVKELNIKTKNKKVLDLQNEYKQLY